MMKFKNINISFVHLIKDYRKNLRHTEGIYCFCNPIIKNEVSILLTSNFIKIFDVIIQAIYFPPSIKFKDFKGELYFV